MNFKSYKLNDELVIEIGKFTILWNIFERNYCNYNCNPASIRMVCEHITIDYEKQLKLSNILNERCKCFCQDIFSYVEESLHPKNAKPSTPENKEIMEKFLKQEDLNLSVGCLLVIHRIRNNLMHGLKLVEELNDQLPLFKAINEVLETIR